MKQIDEQAVLGRVINISDALYNKGLRYAQTGKLSPAMEALEKSLEFDKYNIPARNLLGLCLCQTGRLGDAMRHWIISESQREENNPANGYLENIRTDQRYMDKINHSLGIYNSALEFLRGGSNDMAIMRMKKCVELNPNFTDGLCLLALAYIMAGHAKKAEPHIRKVLQIDPANPRALAYYAVVTGGVNPPPRVRGSGRPSLMDVSGYAKPDNKRNIAQDFRLSEVLSVLISCVITAAVFIFLVLPDREQDLRAALDEQNAFIATLHAAAEIAVERKAEEYRDVDERIAQLEALRDANAAELSILQREKTLREAQDYFDGGDWELSYNTLSQTSTEGFSVELTQQHAQLLRNSAAHLEAGFYRDGKAAFDRRNYEQAHSLLQQAEYYSRGDSPTADLMFYYLGRVAQHNNDADTAIYYYDIVVTKYPSSSQYRDANNRLRQLGN
ncbi:MAG: tetratricopeptide repeat protein [Defluviitaleaceae bacterium]|nr:tetratricopeptide repeat protein [Defluviitaleaceae bacterium]MCL2835253.1 tetratricopeptide repeat protein [Defluviitaleaceae bacterium]